MVQARCKVQGRWSGAGQVEGSRQGGSGVVLVVLGGLMQARCKVQEGRFRRFRGGLVQARWKVQGRFRGSGVV